MLNQEQLKKKSLILFAHMGFLGIAVNGENEFMNDAKSPNAMGCCMKIEDVAMTPEAKEILRESPRAAGLMAPIMLNTNIDGVKCLHSFGKGMGILREPRLGESCDSGLLDEIDEHEFLPHEFVETVERLINGEIPVTRSEEASRVLEALKKLQVHLGGVTADQQEAEQEPEQGMSQTTH